MNAITAIDKNIALETRYSAPNYAPLPVVLTRGEDFYLWDTAGRRYLDMMSAYSAVSHGHRHPRILAAARRQTGWRCRVARLPQRPTRAVPGEICRSCRHGSRVLPMNTGAEAVETAIKAARRWGYRARASPRQAEIIVGAEQFSRPHHDARRFSSEAGLPRRLRSIHARLRHGAVRRRSPRSSGDHARTPPPS